MSLTKASYSMITGAPVNVLDYGADPTGTTDSYAAIQAALTASRNIYIPEGTYLISASLSPRTNQYISGAGNTQTILKATANGINVLNYPSGTYSNVILRDFQIDGDSKAAACISFIGSSQGAISSCFFERITLANAVIYQFYLSKVTYCSLNEVAASGGQYGLFFSECYDTSVNDALIYNGTQACSLIYKGSQIVFKNSRLFLGDMTAPAILILDGGTAHTFEDCSFEPTALNAVTSEVIIKSTGAGTNSVNTDNQFIRCRFIGLYNTKTSCLDVATVGSVYKLKVFQCGFITPASGFSIILRVQQYASLVQNYDLVTYDTLTYADVTVSNLGGQPYYQENLPGRFSTPVVANILIGLSSVATGTAQIGWFADTGSPEGVKNSPVGTLYSRTDGGVGTTFYVKESGTGNTGWVAK